MKVKIFLIFTVFCLSVNSFAAFRVGLLSSISSKKLTGESPITSDDGNLISNGNFQFGLQLSVGLSKSWHVLLGHMSQTYEFDNTEEIIAGDVSIDAHNSYLGLKWVLFSRTALRFLINSQDEIAFTVDDNQNANLYKENLKFLTLYFDQILYLGTSFYAGIKLGYDIGGSGNDIEDRQASRYGLFVTLNTSGWGSLEAYFETRSITKSDSDLNYVETDSNLNINYTVGF